jgi:hypothetical protein
MGTLPEIQKDTECNNFIDTFAVKARGKLDYYLAQKKSDYEIENCHELVYRLEKLKQYLANVQKAQTRP